MILVICSDLTMTLACVLAVCIAGVIVARLFGGSEAPKPPLDVDVY